MLLQVADRKPAGQRARTSHSDSSGTAADSKKSQENAAKDKSPTSRQTAAQERIRAKLIAISEQSAADEVKRSQPTHSRDVKTSSRVRSPSPKRYTSVCIRECVVSIVTWLAMQSVADKTYDCDHLQNRLKRFLFDNDM